VISRPLPRPKDPFPVIANIQGYQTFPSDMAFSPDGKQLAVDYGEKIQIWNLQTPQLAHNIKIVSGKNFTPKNKILRVAFSDNAQQLYTAARQEVQIRDLPSGNVIQRIPGGEVAYPAIAGKLVTLAKDEPYTIKVWQQASGKLLQTIPADFDPFRMDKPFTLSPDQRYLAVVPTLGKNQIQVWDLKSDKQVFSFGDGRNSKIDALSFSPNGAQLVTAQNNQLQIWDWRQGKLFKTITNVDVADRLYWSAIGVFNQGGIPLDNNGTESPYNDFALWHPETAQKLKSWSHPNRPYGRCALSPDGRFLAAYIEDTLSVWQLK
jgi:WD40 repeat protein